MSMSHRGCLLDVLRYLHSCRRPAVSPFVLQVRSDGMSANSVHGADAFEVFSCLSKCWMIIVLSKARLCESHRWWLPVGDGEFLELLCLPGSSAKAD